MTATAKPLFVSIYACRSTAHDSVLDCEIRRVYGYAATCDCGASSDVLPKWSQARQWARAHRAQHPQGATIAAGARR